MTAPTPQPGILSIRPYVGGRGGGVGSRVFKLSSNESALGPSPTARDAFVKAAESLEVYPDGGQHVLKDAIAERYGLSPDRLVCGNGSDEILSYLAQAYLGPGDEAVHSAHGFVMYRLVTLANGAMPVSVPESDLTADVDALLAAVTDRTRIVFLANPNNPTGTYLPYEEVKRLHAGLPDSTLLVVDAAYAEYVGRNDYEAGIELVSTASNVVMTRTFSKIHGLASLRIGWAYAPASVVDVLNRIRGPFNVTGPAIAAGAASLRDGAHLERSAAHNDEWRPRLQEALTGMGLSVTSGVGNFLLVRFPDAIGKDAASAEAWLAERGIYVRNVAEYGLENSLRVTVGSAEAIEAFLGALREFLDGS